MPFSAKRTPVLGQAEFFEPIRDLLHQAAPYGFDAMRSGPAGQKV
jgi:hypothetical protein